MNPVSNNPLRTRADAQAAARALFAPLRPAFSPGGARVSLDVNRAFFSDAAAELEGFSRPLWGLAPLEAGGGDFDGWPLLRQGLISGTNPRHPEFWGEAVDFNQRLVEMAAIGFTLALAPEQFWTPLSSAEQAAVTHWLHQINRVQVHDNNWLFFRVMVNLGLARVGAEHDEAAMTAALDRLEQFYLGDGWYSDGPRIQRDYYVAFAMHFYGLVYARLAGQRDPARAARFTERAALFARDFVHWFTANGAALPFGRSLTYRFAQGSFWGALTFADVEVPDLPWGVVKGLALRHLRWWREHPIFHRDGCLTIGYCYPNQVMAEAYNSPQSPYWAMKWFLPLAVPADHPFWTAPELPLPELPVVHQQAHAGMLICRDHARDHVVALAGGQHALWARHGAEKYAKFAYSTAFGFSVPTGRFGLAQAAPDSTLALSEDGVHFHGREAPIETRLEGEALYSRWQPWPDVSVETWLLPRAPWHIRIHRLRSARPLWSAEGGFALERADDERPELRNYVEGEGLALARSAAGLSGLRDLLGQRVGEVLLVEPNTNLVAPRTVIPALVAQHAPGEHLLACAVLGQPGSLDDAWEHPPALPDWISR